MSDTSDRTQRKSPVTLDPSQTDTVSRALDCAIELETESIEGQCRDCHPERWLECDEHAAARTWRAEYRQLQRWLDRGPEHDLEAGR